MDDTQSRSIDYLVITHFDGREERISLPPSETTPVRIGRETDNDVVLSDPRASRYHAQVRRGEMGLEIMDVGSANGTFVGAQRIEPDTWQPLPPGSIAYLGDTSLTYQPSPASAQTVAVAPVSEPPPPPSEETDRKPAFLPWIAIAGVLVVVLIIIVGAILLTGQMSPVEPDTGDTATRSELAVQTPGAPPSTDTPSTEADLIPYPVVNVQEVRAEPIILGALPDPTKAFIVVRVRVENQGTGDLVVSPSQFQLLDASGEVLMEEGGNYSQEGLRKLGLADRYQDLRLGPGGSVPESLLFAGEAKPYQFFLRYQAPGLDPITLDLGEIDAEREVAMALGTPVGDETPVAVAQASATQTAGPTPTPTRPPELPAPRTVSASSLQGTIAYPVFNGTTYDLYLGKADGSGTSFYLPSASQPQFSPDGRRIAYHSWLAEKRALVTVDVGGGNEHIVAGNLEDQLPTWSPDGSAIMFLTRRRGDRASELLSAPSVGGDPQVVGHGEYPTWSQDGRLAFKGWGEPADLGLRLSPPDLSDPVELTYHDTDTAPAVSPDGEKIAFMSRRDGNWNIYVINSDGNGLLQLTDDPSEDGLPTWSPDGSAIAFVSNRGGPWAVWAVPPGGGGKRQLFTMEGSPDGFVYGEDLDKSRGWAEERISWTGVDY
jgi:pSer/pThr/pTyr-binding forkhead associated (FHA) protein